MRIRRTHYEAAFQAHLERRGTPYVAIEDVRAFGSDPTGVKAFDYIVYPSTGRPRLVDVKGRKSIRPVAGNEWRQKTWVTRADIEGLTEWQGVFGPDYEAAFVFAYWLVERDGAASSADDGSAIARFAGRDYSFWLVPLDEYARHQKALSASWATVAVPRSGFREIARPLEACGPAAPC